MRLDLIQWVEYLNMSHLNMRKSLHFFSLFTGRHSVLLFYKPVLPADLELLVFYVIVIIVRHIIYRLLICAAFSTTLDSDLLPDC